MSINPLIGKTGKEQIKMPIKCAINKLVSVHINTTTHQQSRKGIQIKRLANKANK